jgi:hypothetical protein
VHGPRIHPVDVCWMCDSACCAPGPADGLAPDRCASGPQEPPSERAGQSIAWKLDTVALLEQAEKTPGFQ